MSALAGAPSSSALQSNVVTAPDDLASQLRDTSSGIQDLRGNADHEIESPVDEVNQQLESVAKLNA